MKTLFDPENEREMKNDTTNLIELISALILIVAPYKPRNYLPLRGSEPHGEPPVD